MQAWTRVDNGDNTIELPYRTVVTKRFIKNDGGEMLATVFDKDNNAGAFIVALDDDNMVIIARQYRCGPEMVMDELPGGVVDAHEQPEETAIRELREETGYEATRIEYVGKAYVNPWNNTTHFYYLGLGSKRVGEPKNIEIDEETDVVRISISELINNAKNAKMCDVQAVFLAYDKLKELEGK